MVKILTAKKSSYLHICKLIGKKSELVWESKAVIAFIGIPIKLIKAQYIIISDYK